MGEDWGELGEIGKDGWWGVYEGYRKKMKNKNKEVKRGN